ncbi:high mobility group box domain-containing protein [Cryptosporidium muris RN66]|uniref:High mobility group box domain-containing protein n=1 Tax=Cryptosporidium muris (strain RN66) TaxID=441375 RepID=B6AK12_CRYMR|nr:high mobility group box domain-containing protein [Cryptosporidium muris RN66]EEA08553.1 high mobility group box domain-containing protein [Cryptosporidium muris RN66]|eukprot:XP_002142902.1 high mobility group box domain-containing protein [Cryptosporidium muris RN66]
MSNPMPMAGSLSGLSVPQPNSMSPTVNSGATDAILVDILCEFADFFVDLATSVAARTGKIWKPRILMQQKSKRTLRTSDDPNKPKRPHTAYTLWCEHIRQKVRENDPNRALQMKDLAEMWNNLPEQEKGPWERKAQEFKQKYLAEMAAYRASGPSPVGPSPSAQQQIQSFSSTSMTGW